MLLIWHQEKQLKQNNICNMTICNFYKRKTELKYHAAKVKWKNMNLIL